jgi:hypothetical protein
MMNRDLIMAFVDAINKKKAISHRDCQIFLSAAEYSETSATTPGGRPQRTIKPGSFVVLVVGK